MAALTGSTKYYNTQEISKENLNEIEGKEISQDDKLHTYKGWSLQKTINSLVHSFNIIPAVLPSFRNMWLALIKCQPLGLKYLKGLHPKVFIFTNFRTIVGYNHRILCSILGYTSQRVVMQIIFRYYGFICRFDTQF